MAITAGQSAQFSGLKVDETPDAGPGSQKSGGKKLMTIAIPAVGIAALLFIVPLLLPNKERSLNSCLEEAQTKYQQSWDSQCVSLGKPVNCDLPSSVETTFLQTLQSEKNACQASYGS